MFNIDRRGGFRELGMGVLMDQQNRLTGVRVGVGAALVGASTVAMAELPAAVTAAFTSVQSDGAAMIALGWPVLVAIFGGLLLMKIFKKVGSRAT